VRARTLRAAGRRRHKMAMLGDEVASYQMERRDLVAQYEVTYKEIEAAAAEERSANRLNYVDDAKRRLLVEMTDLAANVIDMDRSTEEQVRAHM
jgi:hypothetical protein